MGDAAPPSRLPLHLASAYTVLVLYASLHPFSGWSDSGAPLFDYLTAPWPRYVTAFDLTVNVLAYLPLGFLWVPALQRGAAPALPAFAAALLCVAVSFALETTQNYLPSRVPSNLDLGCNGIGGAIGALCGARWGSTRRSGSTAATSRTCPPRRTRSTRARAAPAATRSAPPRCRSRASSRRCAPWPLEPPGPRPW